MPLQISVDRERIGEFCHRWKIRELAVFGSVLRDDFRPDSDVDVLVSYHPDSEWGILEHVQMQDELAQIFGRSVDLLTRRAVERSANPIRKRAILENIEVLHAAG